MANTQSVEIAALQASPKEIAERVDTGSNVVISSGNVEFAGTTAADTLQLFRIPVRAKLISLWMGFDDLATTSQTVDVGFYTVGSTTAAGTVVELDILVADLDVAAAIAFADYRYDDLGIETTNEKVWELAQLSAVPSYSHLDVVLTTVATDTPLTATVAYIATYTT